MSTVDEILAAGRYTDRRGRGWKIVRSPLGGIWWGTPHTVDLMLVLHENKMRLLIERDMHRDECCGNRECEDHPVPHVYRAYRSALWHAHPGGARPFAETFTTHAEAMDAARALAVNP